MTMPDDIKLPELPYAFEADLPAPCPGYTKAQMHAYARAAVLADRERRQQWIDVRDRLPEPDEPVLVHNGRWTGVGAWMSGEYLEPIERWQDEHREFIKMIGPAVTHWRPLPAPPAGAQRAKGESNA